MTTKFENDMDEEAHQSSTKTLGPHMTVMPGNNDAGFGKAGFNIPSFTTSATHTLTGGPEGATRATVTFYSSSARSTITPSTAKKNGDDEDDQDGGMRDSNDDNNRQKYNGSSGGQGRGGNGNSRNSKSNQAPNFSDNAIFNPDPTCQVINENDGRLQYTGAWTLESKDPKGIQFTSHTTTTANSQVSFTFNGTSITIF